MMRARHSGEDSQPRQRVAAKPRAAWWCLGLTVALYLYLRFLGDLSALAMLLLGLPQPIWILPALICLGIFAARKMWRGAVIAAGAALFALIAFLGPSCGAQGPPSGRWMLRVMTFNVKRFETASPEAIAGAILEAGADVVCLQEAIEGKERFRQRLARALPGYAWAEADEVPILSRLPIRERHRIPLNDLPEWRPLNVAVVELPQGSKVRILNAHLLAFPWNKPTLANIRMTHSAQQRQARMLVESLENSELRMTVLAGDFNATPLTGTYRLVEEAATDAFARAGSGFGYTLPAGFPMRRIDYLFCVGMTPNRAEVLPLRLSDHRPLLAEFMVGLPE